MVDQRPRNDSSRDLLEELEDGWGAAPSSKGIPSAAAMRDDSSAPDVNDLDEGWLDNLFPEEDDEDEEEEESEPELPDERLDPVAYAAAKKALAERQAAKKEKKKQKLEAKRARQRAKAAAMRQKQKGKSKRKAPPPAAKPEKKKSKAPRPPVREAGDDAPESADDIEAAAEAAIGKKPRAKASASAPIKAAPNTMQSIKLLAIVLAVLLALAGVIAMIAK